MSGVRVVKPEEREVEIASGAMTRLAGVSAILGGAEGIHLAIATIPAGCSSSPHHHTNCESAIYVTKGRGHFLLGDELSTAIPFQAGDFIYVPQWSLHQPVNDGDEPVEMIVARNTPVEIVEEYTGPRSAQPVLAS